MLILIFFGTRNLYATCCRWPTLVQSATRGREALETGTPLIRISYPVSLFADKRSAWRRHGSAIRAYRKCARRDAAPTRSSLLLVSLIPRRCRYVNLTLRPNCTEVVYFARLWAHLHARARQNKAGVTSHRSAIMKSRSRLAEIRHTTDCLDPLFIFFFFFPLGPLFLATT